MAPAFHWLLIDKHRNIVCRGGAGSAKSFSIIQVLLFTILKDLDKPNSHRFLLLRKTRPSAKESILPVIKYYINEWNLDTICKENKTDGTFTFINGSMIMITGLDDPQKIKSIYGIDKIFLEEADEFTLEDFRQLSLRLRGDKKALYQLFLAFNPISSLSWIYQEFYAKERPNTILHLSTYHDNPYLDDAYIEELEDLINQDQNYYNIYVKGAWGSLGHNIYNNWEIVDKYPDIIEEEIWGLDFGYVNPSALGNIHEIRQAGFNIRAADKKPYSVKEGLDFCKRKKLFVSKDSPNLIKELQGYAYKTDKNSLVVDEPIKFNDHGCDAFRYALYTHFARRRDYKIYTGNTEG
jgi:phage terminase large subunit